MADLDMVRRFAGADPDAGDGVLEACYRAAVAWYERAGVPASLTGDLAEFWRCNLAAWFYDNRGGDAETHIPRYIVESVHQLRPRRGGAGT